MSAILLSGWRGNSQEGKKLVTDGESFATGVTCKVRAQKGDSDSG